MKQSSSSKTPVARRRFLRQLMVLGGAAGASTIAFAGNRPGPESASAKFVPASSSAPSKGYRLTEHIRTYYKKAQI